MKKVVCTDLPAREFETVRRQVEGLNLVWAETADQAIAEIADAQGFYGYIKPAHLQAARRLEWFQSPVAGVEILMFPALMESDLVMTNMAGIYSDVISDHVMAYILMFARGMHEYRYQQKERVWRKGVSVRHLAGATLGVAGLGGIGAAVARKGKALGMEVWGLEARSMNAPQGVDVLLRADQLDQLLRKSDFLVLCLPHTPETVGLIGLPELSRMRSDAYLINIGRGVLVKLDDLVRALREGKIAGAGLDVFEVEPLPAEHPLWDMRNVIITPHVAAASSHIRKRHLQLLADNLNRFAGDEPLHNVIDKRKWYLKD